MPSKTQICNFALTDIGEKTISDFDTPTDENGRLCSLLYDQITDECTVRYNWKCAKHRKAVSADGTDPDFEYEAQYSLPTNPYCLRVLKVMVEETELTDWIREGRKILTSGADPDSDEVQLVYLKRITDPAEYDPYLVKYIYKSLAEAIALRRSKSNQIINRIKVEISEILQEARSVNAMEDYVEESNNDWQTAGR